MPNYKNQFISIFEPEYQIEKARSNFSLQCKENDHDKISIQWILDDRIIAWKEWYFINLHWVLWLLLEMDNRFIQLSYWSFRVRIVHTKKDDALMLITFMKYDRVL